MKKVNCAICGVDLEIPEGREGYDTDTYAAVCGRCHSLMVLAKLIEEPKAGSEQ